MTAFPRIPPLTPEAWTPEVRDVFAILEGPAAREEGSKYNIVLTLSHHPELAKAWNGYSQVMLRHFTMPLRLREMITLRVAWLNQSAYEWSQHIVMAKDAGLDATHFEAIKVGHTDPLWPKLERDILRGVDELQEHGRIGDATWAELAGQLDTKQLLEMLFVAGTFSMMAWVLNSLGVEVEPGKPGLDAI